MNITLIATNSSKIILIIINDFQFFAEFYFLDAVHFLVDVFYGIDDNSTVGQRT